MTPSTTLPNSAAALATERDLLTRLYEAGRAEHPGLRLEQEEYARGARERAGWTARDDGGSELDALAAMDRRGRGGDLYLVLACDAGRQEGWERLCAVSLPAVGRALSAQGVSVPEADGLAADLPGHLIQPPRHGRSRTRLGGFRGASTLTTFLAVAAMRLRTSARRVRTEASLDRVEELAATAVGGPVAPAAPARLEDAEAVAQLEALLPAAWARLTRQESLALLFKCRDGLPQATIANLLGIGAPRVSRLVESAHARLRSAFASNAVRGAGIAHAHRGALRGVIERFLATSFPEARPGGAQGPRSARTSETR